MDGTSNVLSSIGSQDLPDNQDQVESQLERLKGYLQDLKQGDMGIGGLKQSIWGNSNPMMQMLSEGLNKVENNQQARQLIEAQIQKLEGHLKNLKK